MKASTFLFAAFSCVCLAQSDNFSCQTIDQKQVTFNASGSVTVPGIDQQQSSWKFNRFITFKNSNGSSNLNELVTLKSPAYLNISNPSLQACLIIVNDLSTNEQLPIKDDGNCTYVLRNPCLGELKQRLSSVILQGADKTCADLIEKIGTSSATENSNCTATTWDGLSSFSFSPSASSCTDSGIVVASYGTRATDVAADDFSSYDKAIGIPQPIIATFWETNVTDSVSTMRTVLQPRVMCISTNNITEGSRSLPEAPSTTTNIPSPSNAAAKSDGSVKISERMGLGASSLAMLSLLFFLIM